MEVLFDWAGEALQSEVFKMTIAFMLAARLHARWVKQEFSLLRKSIDHVAEVMSKRVDGLEGRVKKLEGE